MAKGNYKGRPKGSVNKKTQAIKDFDNRVRSEAQPMKEILTAVAHMVFEDIDKIYKQLMPREKLELLKITLPFIQPKLETIKYEDADGNAASQVQVIVLGAKRLDP